VTKGDIEPEIVYESDYADEANLRLGKIEGEIGKWNRIYLIPRSRFLIGSIFYSANGE